MSEAELLLMKEAKNCTMYTVQFLDDEESEFEKFYQRFKDDVELNTDLMRIVGILGKIADWGALERYFRPEGKMKDNVVALPVIKSRLRLYCLRLSDKILILGNGGEKKTASYDADNELNGFVLTLQKFDKLIEEGVKEGSITVTENKIITDTIFDL